MKYQVLQYQVPGTVVPGRSRRLDHYYAYKYKYKYSEYKVLPTVSRACALVHAILLYEY